MSEAENISPVKHDQPERSPVTSPGKGHFLIPSPLPTRRTRTYSQTERALAGPSFHGRIKSFCREKGHGFIIPREEGGEPLFVHISEIEGDFVPKQGDEVKYKKSPIPPKNEKFCAAHVHIVHPAEGVTHETWEGGMSPVHGTPS